MTDHYGRIVNFDVLVGCLLSDVPEPMSGELVVYPGSHLSLAAYFAQVPSALRTPSPPTPRGRALQLALRLGSLTTPSEGFLPAVARVSP